ncbi:uncharacterized protein LOC133816300 [Humulus lupulus]|uniref:uncharacterized protein LOC133816300 n=1 Tax=Humulus lupulus TaxID=3486 RepID=UPI002B4123F1|nr:uncharacterized protein LOC133816300 [Humulus lupulus]
MTGALGSSENDGLRVMGGSVSRRGWVAWSHRGGFSYFCSELSSSMAALNISTRMSLLKPERTPDFLPSSKRLSDFLAFQSRPRKKCAQKSHAFTVRSMTIAKERYRGQLNSPNGLAGCPDKYSLYDD